MARQTQVSVTSTLCHCGAKTVSVVPTRPYPRKWAAATRASVPTSHADENPKLLSRSHQTSLFVAAVMCAALILWRHATLQRIQAPGFNESWHDRQCQGRESEQRATSPVHHCAISKAFTMLGFGFPGRKGNNIPLNMNTVIPWKL